MRRLLYTVFFSWGEFEIAITLYFQSDACDKPLNLYHHLKLNPEDESGPMLIKKPFVVESYDEFIFPEPSKGFLYRMQNHPAVNLSRLPAVLVEVTSKQKKGDTKDHPPAQWFMNFSKADKLLQLVSRLHSKTPATNKLDRWAESTFEISPQPVNALMKSFEILFHIGLD